MKADRSSEFAIQLSHDLEMGKTVNWVEVLEGHPTEIELAEFLIKAAYAIAGRHFPESQRAIWCMDVLACISNQEDGSLWHIANLRRKK